jgi:hypothetical protein
VIHLAPAARPGKTPVIPCLSPPLVRGFTEGEIAALWGPRSAWRSSHAARRPCGPARTPLRVPWTTRPGLEGVRRPSDGGEGTGLLDRLGRSVAGSLRETSARVFPHTFPRVGRNPRPRTTRRARVRRRHRTVPSRRSGGIRVGEVVAQQFLHHFPVG